jgi:hypothetical protein
MQNNAQFDRQYTTLVSTWKRHQDLARSGDFQQLITARQELDRARAEMARVRNGR